MKKLILTVRFLLGVMGLYAQNYSVPLSDLPVIGISRSVSLHFISPEKISYVDLSSNSVVGDIPEKNVLRVKVVADSVPALEASGDAGTLTVVGETFIAQYRLYFLPNAKIEFISSQVEISPEHTKPLDVSGVGLSLNQLKANALSMLSQRARQGIRKVSDYGISLKVNRISTAGDFVLLDLSFGNATNLSFDVDQLRFKIEDRKINKATNVQSIEIRPVFQLYPFEQFKREYRNIYVLKKATFPGDKVLNVELSEKQISGRNLRLSLRYSDLLDADTF